jgi:hypothetical protein
MTRCGLCFGDVRGECIRVKRCIFSLSEKCMRPSDADALDGRRKVESDYIEVCTNCGAYYTPRPGQDYYDTRCGKCSPRPSA